MKNIFKSNFDSVVLNFTFSDFINCLVEFCRNKKYVKTSLHAVEMIRQAIPRMADISNPISRASTIRASNNLLNDMNSPIVVVKPSLDEDPNYKFWFPILFGLYEIVMTSELEVRTRALTYLFETLKIYGDSFPKDFWEVIAKGVIFPIFDDLKLSKQETTKYENGEDMSVWISTTLIQALRHLIDLYSHFFSTLRFMTDGVLELLSRCMTQGVYLMYLINNKKMRLWLESDQLVFINLSKEMWIK